jgi:hypothetical protein
VVHIRLKEIYPYIYHTESSEPGVSSINGSKSWSKMSVSSILKWNSVLFSDLVAAVSSHESPSAHREFPPTFGLLDSNVPEYSYNQQKKEVHFSSFMVNFGNI